MKQPDEPAADATGSPSGTAGSGEVFVTTHWSVVLMAAREDRSRAREALATLCQTYWRPLYAYVRRQGSSKENAEDLVQGFFAHFLEKNRLEGVHPGQGRFRAFLLASLKNFLANEWDRAHRKKRGGHLTHLSLDWQDADARYHLSSSEGLSPDKIYDREWALTLLEQVLRRLREEYVAEGKAVQFEHLKGCLTASQEDVDYEKAARELGVEPGAVRVTAHRLRKRYRALIREEIAQTLASSERVDEEMRALFAALTG